MHQEQLENSLQVLSKQKDKKLGGSFVFGCSLEGPCSYIWWRSGEESPGQIKARVPIRTPAQWNNTTKPSVTLSWSISLCCSRFLTLDTRFNLRGENGGPSWEAVVQLPLQAIVCLQPSKHLESPPWGQAPGLIVFAVYIYIYISSYLVGLYVWMFNKGLLKGR